MKVRLPHTSTVAMTCVSFTELSREKSQFLADQMRSKVIEELLEFDRSLLMTVETVLKNKLPSADGEKFSIVMWI